MSCAPLDPNRAHAVLVLVTPFDANSIAALPKPLAPERRCPVPALQAPLEALAQRTGLVSCSLHQGGTGTPGAGETVRKDACRPRVSSCRAKVCTGALLA